MYDIELNLKYDIPIYKLVTEILPDKIIDNTNYKNITTNYLRNLSIYGRDIDIKTSIYETFENYTNRLNIILILILILIIFIILFFFRTK
jgi:hypothetical protein